MYAFLFFDFTKEIMPLLLYASSLVIVPQHSILLRITQAVWNIEKQQREPRCSMQKCQETRPWSHLYALITRNNTLPKSFGNYASTVSISTVISNKNDVIKNSLALEVSREGS